MLCRETRAPSDKADLDGEDFVEFTAKACDNWRWLVVVGPWREVEVIEDADVFLLSCIPLKFELWRRQLRGTLRGPCVQNRLGG